MRSLVRAADIEVIPLKGVDQKWGDIPPGTTVTVTVSPRFGLERTLDYAELAAKAGFTVVPHLAARQVHDESELHGFIERIEGFGVKNLYVIGGDADEPVGVYSSAAEILHALSGIEHHLERIGVACYPEGHPKISDEALLEALQAKQPLANYMVSQLCFDVEALRTWLRKTRSLGIGLPLHLGLAAPMNARKLVELSVQIGVGSSLRYLSKQHGVIGHLFRGNSYRPETLLQRLGADLTSPELNIEGLHLFSFNQITPTVEWQRRVVEGA